MSKNIYVMMKPRLALATKDGDKWETRRIMDPQPFPCPARFVPWDESNGIWIPESNSGKTGIFHPGQIKCPYGVPGDILCVKEEHYVYGCWKIDGLTKKTKKPRLVFIPTTDDKHPVLYTDNRPEKYYRSNFDGRMCWGYFKRNSMFMPDELIRTRRKIVAIRAEELGNITKEGFYAEGYMGGADEFERRLGYRKMCWDQWYMRLWESINGAGSWAKNPWVWVITFEKKAE